MKNDWVSSPADTGTRANMNRPFWLVSGAKSGGNVVAFISPGRVRFPYVDKVVYSGQQQSITFSASANNYYTVFLRQDGTFMVSGSSSATIPDPPRWDAEPIGQINVGAFTASSDLKGPWNQTTNFNPYEQRGEIAAVMPTRPRALFEHHSRVGHLDLSSASGIAYLNFATNPAPQQRNATLVQGMVYWVPSGAVTAGNLYISPTFSIRRNTTAGSANLLITNHQTHHWVVDQNPDGATTAAQHATTSVMVVDQPNIIHSTPSITSTPGASLAGYELLASRDSGQTDTGTAIRITRVIFTAIPGFYGSEPSEES